ncbi:MAG: TRAP transporter large permease [Eubacteriales bacterium]|jgi:tripartite ATP-independent transporter DctM subunit
MNAVCVAAVVLLVSLFSKIPVFVSIMLGSISYFFLVPEVSMQIVVQRFTSGLESVPLLAAPFFICAGVFMNYCGVTTRIMHFCTVLTGRMSGGLAQVNVLMSTLMGGLCGSNIADAAMEAKILVPEMEKQGLPKPFSTVVTAFSAVITPLIPPGVLMILYGALASVSIGQLFISGISVGLITCVCLMVLTAVISKKNGYRPYRTEKATVRDFMQAFTKALLPLCLPIIIIGGIRIGVFTPTEAGAIAVAYALFLGIYYRELSWDDFVAGIKEAVITTGAIELIIGAASVFAWILTKEQVPQKISEWMLLTISNKYLFLLLVNLFLLVVGMFIEGTAAAIVLVPLLAPIAAAFQIDPIQFAFIFIFNFSIGAITPPMGTLMFVTCSVTKCKTKDFLKASVPYFAVFFFILAIITLVPLATTGILKLFY